MAVVVLSGISSVIPLIMGFSPYENGCPPHEGHAAPAKLRTGNVHGRQAKNGHRLIHAGLNHAQQARLRSRLLQSFREQEEQMQKHDAVQQLHPSAGVEDKKTAPQRPHQ